MNGMRQGWLVARREIRERSRSKVFRAGIVIMLVVVVAAIVVAAKTHTGNVTRDVGFTGTTPAALPTAVIDQGKAVDVTVRPHQYGGAAAGEQAVRDRKVAVLVVDARTLTWPGQPDERLRAIATGAIQLVTLQQRAAAAGIDPGQLQAVMAPVPVENQQLAVTAGRSTGNVLATLIMSMLLLMTIMLYGNLVLTGVAEEKSSRVVEVLLARMPARNLLAGKVAGIGLLGFAQFTLTALAALIAALAVHPAGIPAIGGGVLAWVIVWFVLGYALYAMAYGALGSLASRAEDAANVAAPVGYVLAAAYFASYIVVAGNPDSAGSKLVSLFPATAPFAMSGRIAVGAAAWWEPVIAVVLAVAAIAGLAVLAGRVYTGAILHTGPTLKLRAAWSATTRPGPRAAEPPPTAQAHRWEDLAPHGKDDDGIGEHAAEKPKGGAAMKRRRLSMIAAAVALFPLSMMVAHIGPTAVWITVFAIAGLVSSWLWPYPFWSRGPDGRR
jgi:ABC-2 type transport system permease protein